MYNHAPEDYVCPICQGIKGVDDATTMIRESDIVYIDDLVMVFVASFFIGNNPGHLIVVPLEHFENVYDLPDGVGARIFKVARKMALAIKQAYNKCKGVMILQNNEPASGQHAFHYHLHVFPRYNGDELHAHMLEKRATEADERKPFVHKIKTALNLT